MPKSKTARRGIKNYTTTISVDKTIMEIEQLLTRFGARKILKEYDECGIITHLTFLIRYKTGFIPIKLPSHPEKIILILNEKADAGEIPKKFKNDMEQASRIMWRVILDWIDSQITMLEIGQRTLLEIFFADICPPGQEENFYQKTIKDKGSVSYFLIEDI